MGRRPGGAPQDAAPPPPRHGGRRRLGAAKRGAVNAGALAGKRGALADGHYDALLTVGVRRDATVDKCTAALRQAAVSAGLDTIESETAGYVRASGVVLRAGDARCELQVCCVGSRRVAAVRRRVSRAFLVARTSRRWRHAIAVQNAQTTQTTTHTGRRPRRPPRARNGDAARGAWRRRSARSSPTRTCGRRTTRRRGGATDGRGRVGF